jgi:hypothetical protein
MLGLYEAHVTVEKPANDTERLLLEAVGREYHWKTSEIDGDPVLGKNLYYYFTSHAHTYDALLRRMQLIVQDLRGVGVHVVREKIEHIVYDVRH